MRKYGVGSGVQAPASVSTSDPAYARGTGHQYSTGKRHTTTLPTLTPEQWTQVLEKAAATRSHHARIKPEFRGREFKPSGLLAALKTNGILGEMKVKVLFISPPRIGTATADTTLADVHIAESWRVCGLGTDQ